MSKRKRPDSENETKRKRHKFCVPPRPRKRKRPDSENVTKRKRHKDAKTSKYKGVSWNVKNQKWMALISVNKKKEYGGCYTSDLDAAYAVNALCDDLGLDRKNLQLGDPPSNWKRPLRKKAAKTSKYKGVSWHAQSQKWQSSIWVNKKREHGGIYTSDLDAAHAVNELCDDLGLDRKNPELGDPPSNWKRASRKKAAKTSKYKGVCWYAQSEKWHASITVNNKSKYGGLYTSDLDAAHAVNALCDDWGVDRKNPELGDQFIPSFCFVATKVHA